MKEKKVIVWLYASLALVALLQIPFIFNGVEHTDEGTYLFIGARISEGKLLYKDYFEQKTPGIMYFIASVFTLFGRSLTAAKTALVAVNLITALFLLRIGWRLYGKSAGIFAAILYLLSIVLYEGSYIVTEPFVAFFTSFATLVYIERGKHLSAVFLAGLVSGTAALFKQPALLYFGALLLAVSFSNGLKRKIITHKRVVPVLTVMVGFALPFVATAVYFLYTGIFSDWITASFYKPTVVYPPTPLFNAFVGLYYLLFRFPFIWAFSAIAALLIAEDAMKKRANHYDAFLLVALGLSLVSLAIRQYPHYIVPALPFAVLLSSKAASQAWRSYLRKSRDNTTGLVLLVSAGFLIFPAAIIFLKNVDMYAIHGSLGSQMEVANVIKENTAPNEPILVMETGAEYYFLSERNPPFRAPYFSLLTADMYTKKQLMDLLTNGTINYVVLTYHGITPIDKVPYIDEIKSFVETNYTLVKSVDVASKSKFTTNKNMIYLYRRKS